MDFNYVFYVGAFFMIAHLFIYQFSLFDSNNATEDLVDDIRKSLRKSKIKYSNLGSKITGAVVTITDPEKITTAKNIIKENIE